MCTVSAWNTPSGLHLFFNRDEQRTRPPADPPRPETIRGMPVLAPKDPEGGGTWLGVNAAGMAVGILNYYHAANMPEEPAITPVSRGLLVMDLLVSPNPETGADSLRSRSLAAFRPFELFAMVPGLRGFYWRWDGQALLQESITGPTFWISSSSYNPHEVIQQRRRAWMAQPGQKTGKLDRHSVMALHAGWGRTLAAFTTRMVREDARTVSITELKIRSTAATMKYFPLPENGGDPDWNAPITHILPRSG